MKVICKGYKNCDQKLECDHSKEHEWNKECFLSEHHSKKCECSSIYLRKNKLKKLNESNL